MPTYKHIVSFATAMALAGAVFGYRAIAADDENPAAESKPAVATPPAADSKDSPPDLQKIIERLNRVERELVELRIKSGKIPDDKKDQRVITLLDTPYLGSAFYGSPTNQRFFTAKLSLVNL